MSFTLLASISSFELNLGSTYYVVLIVVFSILFVSGKSNKFNFLMLWIVLAGLLSILFNKIPSFFNPYDRFAAFIFVMGLVGPMIRNSSFKIFRILLFKMLKFFIVIIVTISFLGISAGLPSMIGRGGFVGLFNHSMTLGPMAAIAMLFCISWGNTTTNKIERYLFFALVIISFLTCLAAGSRAALIAGIAGVIFFYYKTNQGNLSLIIRINMFILSLAILSFPLWESYTERIMGKMSYSEEQGTLIFSRESLWKTRILEFEKSPIYGVGFNAVDIKLTDKYDPKKGKIEPGSSWLAVLSMTGILGFFPFIFLIFTNLKFLYQVKPMSNHLALLGSLLILFLVHMVAEGYVFSAGSGMFFIFWLIMGLIEEIKNIRSYKKYSI